MTRDIPGRRVDWRLAVMCTAALTVLFGLQQYLGQPALARRGPTLGRALATQAVTWTIWLVLLPAIIWAARRHPLGTRPTARWWIISAVEGIAFVAGHAVLAG